MLYIWLWKGATELRPSRNAGARACPRNVVITGQGKSMEKVGSKLMRVCHGLDNYTFRKCRLIALQLSYQLWKTPHTMIIHDIRSRKAHILISASYTWSRTYSIWASSLLRCQAHLWNSSHALRPPLCEAGWAWPCGRCCIRIGTVNYSRKLIELSSICRVIDGLMDGWTHWLIGCAGLH